MTYVLEVFTTEEGDSDPKSYKTLGGATSAGIRALEKQYRRKFYGYQAADRQIGEQGWRGKHVVAEWKDRGRVLAIVWT
jgi:hypothetical protein